MADMQEVVLVIEQTIEHRVKGQVSLDEVRARLAQARPGTIVPEMTAHHVQEWLTSHRDWSDDLGHHVAGGAEAESTEQRLIEGELIR